MNLHDEYFNYRFNQEAHTKLIKQAQQHRLMETTHITEQNPLPHESTHEIIEEHAYPSVFDWLVHVLVDNRKVIHHGAR